MSYANEKPKPTPNGIAPTHASRRLSRRIRRYAIGGKLAFLLMPLPLLGGCPATVAVTTCHPDLSLLQEIALSDAPQGAINGDLGVALRDLRDKVDKDNAQKRALREQLTRCD